MKVKKLAAMLLVLAMMLTVLTSTALAEARSINEDDGVAPLYDVCLECGGYIHHEPTVWGPWLLVGYDICTCNGLQIRDGHATYTRTGVSTWKCNGCGRGTSTSVNQTEVRCLITGG